MPDNSTYDQLSVAYNNTFNRSNDGLLVLDDLHRHFVDREETDSLDALRLAFAAGQRSVVRHVVTMRSRLGIEQSPQETE